MYDKIHPKITSPYDCVETDDRMIRCNQEIYFFKSKEQYRKWVLMTPFMVIINNLNHIYMHTSLTQAGNPKGNIMFYDNLYMYTIEKVIDILPTGSGEREMMCRNLILLHWCIHTPFPTTRSLHEKRSTLKDFSLDQTTDP